MKKLYSLVFAILFLACESYQKDDTEYFDGDWNIESVSAGGKEIIQDYGTIHIDKYGKGTIELKYSPYNANSSAVKGVFNLVTSSGKDLHIDLYGAMWLDADGKASSFFCSQESKLSVRVEKMRRKSMNWTFDDLTTSIYPCALNNLTGANWDGATDVTWKLKKK